MGGRRVLLTFPSLLLLGGALATAYRSRCLYLIAMVVYLEGVGAALFMPSSMALLVGMFIDPEPRARTLGLYSAIVATPQAIGPSVGGILVSAFGWRSIFLINIPVVIGIALTSRVIPATAGTGGRVSPVGNALFLVAVGVWLIHFDPGAQQRVWRLRNSSPQHQRRALRRQPRQHRHP